MPSMLEKVRGIAAKVEFRAPEKPAMSSLFAEAGTRPADWQIAPIAVSNVQGRIREPVGDSDDLKRVLSLERRQPVAIDDPNDPRTIALVELMTSRLTRGPRICRCRELGRKECITRLKPAQAWALYEAPLAGGLLGPIGVGHGKTGLDILMAMVMPNCQRAVVLLPPNLRNQFFSEFALWAEHFNVPNIADGSTFIPGRPMLHVVSFGKFCREEHTDLLERINPDLVIVDEAHKLANTNSATGSRVVRFYAAQSDSRLCAWSGTLTKDSIRNYAHLSAFALKDGSPLPLDPDIVAEWAKSIDPSEWPAEPGKLMQLCDPGEHVRKGFSRRLLWTLGVVSTKASAVNCSLNLFERKAPTMPAGLKQMLHELRDTWTRPDGEEFIDALRVAECAKQLACGFYYRWIFPRGEPVELIEEWFKARQAWHREMRALLKQRLPYLDSELLCTRAAIRAWEDEPYQGDMPVWKAQSWPAWRDIRKKVYHETEAVWVDDYLARDAAVWGKAHRGIIWYEHDAFGQRVSELSGLALHSGGPHAEALIKAETGKKSIVASISSHGVGRDELQFKFREQLVTFPPSSGLRWEQLLGRLHRIGQTADEVDTFVYRHTAEMSEAIDKALVKAKYMEDTMENEQKLLHLATPDWRLR